MAGTLEVPAEGNPNTTEDPKIKAAIKRLNELLNASNLVEGAGIGSATVTDTNLASPNNSAYRTIFLGTESISGAKAAATYLIANRGGVVPFVSGESISAASVPLFYFAKADYEVAGKTQKLRLRAQVGSNATKATMTFTFGLYPVTVAGGASEFKPTLGTVVSGSTVAINEPAASTVSQSNSGDFTIPADGAYVIGLVTSAETTANTVSKLNAQLQTRSV